MTAAAIVSLRVKVSRERAFKVFTEEIGSWWRPNALFPLTPSGDGALSFEPGAGGRLIAALPSGTIYEAGRILVWAPGERIVFTFRPATFAPDQATEVEVRFDPVGDETRVTVSHRGWDAIPAAHAARHGFPLMVFQQRLAEFWRERLRAIGSG